MIKKVQKRFPIGFLGQWAKVYTLYTYDDYDSNDKILWQDKNYVAIPNKVQVIDTNDNKQQRDEALAQNLITHAEYRTIKTSDAYWDGRQYNCIMEENDLIQINDEWYEVEEVMTKTMHTPKPQSIYTVGLKKIFDL